MREYQVRICERLGVKFPGPTRQSRHFDRAFTHFRGRDASYLAPPAQIRTGPIRAYGSHLGCLTAKRFSGHG